MSNSTSSRPLDHDAVRVAIIDQAEARVLPQYPQYEGHWHGPEWHVVKLRRGVRTKMGQAFLKGDITIARENGLDENDGDRRGTFTAYSTRNGIDTSVPATWLEVLS